jgi:hypothetical protein
MNGENYRKRKVPFQPGQQVLAGKRISRNSPCFCGSGKKFKKCHGVRNDHHFVTVPRKEMPHDQPT